jgi:hypothetical protein
MVRTVEHQAPGAGTAGTPCADLRGAELEPADPTVRSRGGTTSGWPTPALVAHQFVAIHVVAIQSTADGMGEPGASTPIG